MRLGKFRDFVHGMICFMMGISLASLISSITKFYNYWFVIVFGSLFGLTLIFKTEKMWNNLFNKNKKKVTVKNIEDDYRKWYLGQ